MKTHRFETLRRRLGAGLHVVTTLVGKARCVKQAREPSTSRSDSTNGVHTAEIGLNTASSLPESASSLAARVALVSSPAGLWACSGGSWC
jgi:hypothetical protein